MPTYGKPGTWTKTAQAARTAAQAVKPQNQCRRSASPHWEAAKQKKSAKMPQRERTARPVSGCGLAQRERTSQPRK